MTSSGSVPCSLSPNKGRNMVKLIGPGASFIIEKEVVGPLLVISDADVESWGDDSDLVDSAGQVDDDLAAPVVVDNLELADVSVLHHDGQEADDDAGAGTEGDLALAALFSVIDTLQGVGQTVHQHHDVGFMCMPFHRKK